MPPVPAGPYRKETTTDGVESTYYIITFDKNGACTSPETLQHLLDHATGHTDIYIFSHGWNNDWTAATRRYDSFVDGVRQLRTDHSLSLPPNYRPLLVGIFWPSQALELFASEKGPDFAGGDSETQSKRAAELEELFGDMTDALSADQRQRFVALMQTTTLAKGEDRELASLLEVMAKGSADVEAGTMTSPSAADLLSAAVTLETPEPDYDELAPVDGPGDEVPAAAFSIGGVLRVLDPRNIVKPFTVWQMKDRAGKVGANGAAALLRDMLARSDETARIHLLGHSYGCKVVMTAACAMPNPPRQIESALLLQPAVSQYAFAPNVPGRGVPGGFVPALQRIKRPIVATFSHYDGPLSKMFHLAVRRHDDLGELQYAGTPSKFGALGGFGPQDSNATILLINDPVEEYPLDGTGRIIGVNGASRIGGHGDISNEATWWASYSLATAHLRYP